MENCNYNGGILKKQHQESLASNIYNLQLCSNQQYDTLFSRCFKTELYPQSLNNVNTYCPICVHYVHKQQDHLTYYSPKYRKKFLAHQNCINKEETTNLTIIFDQVEETKVILTNPKKTLKSIGLGCREFYLELKLIHPLSNRSFLKIFTKVTPVGDRISWRIHQDDDQDSYTPNIVGLPVLDFKLSLMMTNMKNNEKTKLEAYVNLGSIKQNENQKLTAYGSDYEIEFDVVFNQKQKQQIIHKMNYKYKYPIDLPFPLIELLSLDLKLSQDLDEDIQTPVESNATIVQLLNQRTQETTSSTVRSQNTNGQLTISDRSFEREKVDLEKLIKTENLCDFVKNNTQSRIFQNFLNQATQEQVQKIISDLWQKLPELITHEYANYMMQKLFGVCGLEQRIRIMHRLKNDITSLICNKQGTHTLQTYIAHFTNEEEFKMMCQTLISCFYQLATHPNGTHFLQKMMTNFPIIHILPFMRIVCQNFTKFSVDKNAMCVLKHMMKRMKYVENQGKATPELNEIKKNFLNAGTFNIDLLIQDAYGNYIIQFCYELFGENKCLGITEMILQRFSQFSIQKYSSSVIYKCLSNYWHETNFVDKLKNILNSESIMQLYRNRDGNKVLLEIMQRYDGTSLRTKIYNQLVTAQPTKFYHDRWGVTLGTRSGNVGQFSSFTDATKKVPSFKNKKNNYHNIH